MAFGDNSKLITTADNTIMLNNGTNDTVANTTGATAFSFSAGNTGDDQIENFGKNDTILNYQKIFDGNNDGIIKGSNGNITLANGAGSVALTDIDGNALTTIEFDGSVVRDGITYYVYSAVGSDAGVAGLNLG